MCVMELAPIGGGGSAVYTLRQERPGADKSVQTKTEHCSPNQEVPV